MKKRLTLAGFYLLIIFYSGSLQSCSKYTVTTNNKNSSDLVYKKYTTASYLWGTVNKPHTIIDTTCGTSGLSEVKITSNIGYSLINVVTLGIVHLIKIECKCQKQPPIIGEQP